MASRKPDQLVPKWSSSRWQWRLALAGSPWSMVVGTPAKCCCGYEARVLVGVGVCGDRSDDASPGPDEEFAGIACVGVSVSHWYVVAQVPATVV